MKKSRVFKKWKVLALIMVLAIVCGVFFYINDYYRALPEALSVIASPADGMTILEEKNEQIVFAPENATIGFIFYPGGKVQYEAYAPLMEACAEQGILCVLLHMPANLAVLDVDAAEGIVEEYPEIEKWYIGGHSLGGSMAAAYAAEHPGKFEGVILLASYSTAALQNSVSNVISIYGSKDQVLNLEKYEEYRSNLPEDFHEEIMEGGNHAYFGTYGPQKGDGEATITNEVQIQLTAEMIAEKVNEK